MVHANGAKVREALDRVVGSVRDNSMTLVGTRDSILSMEHVSNRMFNAVISARVSPQDSAIVELAAKVRDEFVGLAERAVAQGELSMEQLFDTNYVRVLNSNPERFRTTLCDWADAHWRPLFDRIVAQPSRDQDVVSGRYERVSADAYHRMLARADRRSRARHRALPQRAPAL